MLKVAIESEARWHVKVRKRAADLLEFQVATLGDVESARSWMTTKQPGLGKAVPLDFARTEIGAREVENLLGRIEYGVYS